jgi:hypothetical protein
MGRGSLQPQIERSAALSGRIGDGGLNRNVRTARADGACSEACTYADAVGLPEVQVFAAFAFGCVVDRPRRLLSSSRRGCTVVIRPKASLISINEALLPGCSLG